MTADLLVVVAPSPTQVLHALELAHTESGHPTMVVPHAPDPVAEAQIVALLADLPPRVQLERVTLGSIPAKLGLLRQLSHRFRGQRLAIGEYRLDLFRELAHRIAPPELILLDDGNATLLIAEARNRQVSATAARYGGRRRSLRHRLHRLAGVSGPEPGRLTYFTIYDLHVAADDRVRRHRYDWLRTAYPPPLAGGPPALLGSSAVESGILDVDDYRGLIAGAAASEHPPVQYLPHRREDPPKVDAIARQFGLDVIQPSTPVEHAFHRWGSHPSVLWTFPSTVVDTLPLALPAGLQLEVLIPEVSMIRPDYRPEFDILQRHLATTRPPVPMPSPAVGEDEQPDRVQ